MRVLFEGDVGKKKEESESDAKNLPLSFHIST